MAPSKRETAENGAPNLGGSKSADVDDKDKVHVFTIDDRPYFISGKPRIALPLRYMRNLRKHGQSYAEALFLEEVLGEEAHEALISCDDLTQEELEKVIEIATKAAFGDLEAPKATSKKGTRK